LGICYSRKACGDLGGISSGNCARNWGTCCVSKCLVSQTLFVLAVEKCKSKHLIVHNMKD